MSVSPGPQIAPRQVAYLGLGSNLGDRLSNLRAATHLFDATEGVRVVERSSVYETEPVGELTDQPDFYNAALKVETDMSPLALLDACKRVERELGRPADGERHGPRAIDVDLLLIGDLELQEGRLTLPHPEVANRRFVLVPLLELDPALALPGGQPLADALGELGDEQRVVLVGPLARS